MSLFLGAWVPHGTVPPDTIASLRQALGSLAVSPTEITTPSAVILSVDYGARGASGTVATPDGAVTVVAGDPLVPGRADRAGSAAYLHDLWRSESWSGTGTANGTFCAVHLAPQGSLHLVADNLGLRPIYYAQLPGDPELVVFSTALKYLVGLPGLPLTTSLRGLMEDFALGVSLAARTQYVETSRLMSGEVISYSRDGRHHRRYRCWDRIQSDGSDLEESSRNLYAALRRAVTDRLGSRRECVSFLSGGLDSRSVVCLLTDSGARVRTFNFSHPGSQDRGLGEMFARALGTEHRSLPMIRTNWWEGLALALQGGTALAPVREARLAWSGDGGSIGTGHVRVESASIAALRRGSAGEAATLALARWGAQPPRRLVLPRLRETAAFDLALGVSEALVSWQPADPGRSLYHLLMENDQRRHLDWYFEDLDRHGIELELPFFDTRVLEQVLHIGLDDCLGHRAYHRMLDHFPPVMVSTPWQTYPGHVPCPLPLPEGLSYQWGDRKPRRGWRARGALARQTGLALLGTGAAIDLVDRGTLGLAAAAHGLGLRDTSHLLRAFLALDRTLQVTGGRWAIQ